MTSIKVKFRPSKVEGKEGAIFYQIIHERVIRHIATEYRIYSSEWDEELERIETSQTDSSRNRFITNIKERIKLDITRLTHITASLNKHRASYSVDDVAKAFAHELRGETFFKFALGVINRLRELRRERCVETYSTTLKCFTRFREGQDLLITDITSDMMLSYEAYLKYEGISMNTISFYMRIMRAIYNRAVEQELVEQRHPFKKVYTGVDKTIKRAITLKYMKRLKELDLSTDSQLGLIRDMFLFSFYTRGMSFVDMTFLRKSDLKSGAIIYRRRKTGQQLRIKWERCMEEIVERYDTSETKYLLPIIKVSEITERNQYRNALVKFNRNLKKLGEMIGLSEPLTMYVARHTWASVAKNKNVPISVISEGMGHDSEATTQIYLASLDTSIVDKANNMILKLI